MSPRADLVPQEWFTAAQLAELNLPGLAASKRGILDTAEREGWAGMTDLDGVKLARPRKGRGGGTEYHLSLLPEAARAALSKVRPAAAKRADRETTLLRYERLPQGLKDEALRRLVIIQRVEQLQRDGLTKTKAIEYAVGEVIRSGQDAAASCRTVNAWFQRILGVEVPDRVAYLAPDYAGRAPKIECHPDLWDAYKTGFLRQEEPTHARIYREVSRLVESHGWGPLPSPKYFERRVAREIPENVLIHRRKGAKAARHTFAYADRTREGLYPHRVANLDGHTWDVWVEWEDGTTGRPVSLAVQDIASGMPLGVRHDRTLNHHQVRLALGDTFRDFGLVERLIMDNGTENQAKQIAGGIPRMRGKAVEEEPDGLLKILGIQTVFATPYWGQAKPVERMFRNWAHDLAKSSVFAGAYTGHNTTSRPDNHRSRAIPIAEFERIVATELEFYRDQLGRSGAGMNGRSFRQVYLEGVAAHPPKRLAPEQLRLCMLSSIPRPMDSQSGAVTVLDHRYWSPELAALKRQKVVVRFDPADLAKPVYVYSLDGRYLAEAKRVMQGSFDDVAAARAITKARRDYVRATKLQSDAATRMSPGQLAAALTAQVPTAPVAPQGNVIAPAFGVPRTAAGGGSNFTDDWEAGVANLFGRK
jgi:putative transposase